MRWVRGGVLAESTVVLAVIAHLLGSGSAPATPALALAALVLRAFAVAASDRQWSPLRALLVVVGAEAGLHAWFCLTANAVSTRAASARAGVAGALPPPSRCAMTASTTVEAASTPPRSQRITPVAGVTGQP